MPQYQHRSWLSQRLSNNIGKTDRFMRSLAGAGLVLAGWLMQIPEAFWLGMFLIVTATFKFCPNYAIFNFHTLGEGEVKTVIPWNEFLDMLPNRVKSASTESQIPKTVFTDVEQLPARAVSRIDETIAVDTLTAGIQTSSPTGDVGSQSPKAAKVIRPVDFALPPELTHALIKDIEKNALDEMLVVRFFENFFGCKISIQSAAHMHIYVCQFTDHTARLDFAKLKSMLLRRLHETAL